MPALSRSEDPGKKKQRFHGFRLTVSMGGRHISAAAKVS